MGVDVDITLSFPCVVTSNALRDMSTRLTSLVGSQHFFLDRKNNKHALELSSNGTRAQVHTNMQYYGPGYERGSWPTIRAILVALQGITPPGTIVHYGSDTGSSCTADAVFLQTIDHYWLDHSREPYINGFAYRLNIKLPKCTFCQRLFVESGGGGAQKFIWCPGCGQKAIEFDKKLYIYSRDNSDKYVDVFQFSDALSSNELDKFIEITDAEYA